METISCLICDDETPEVAHEYEVGGGIRAHLVDAHATYVARAFLFPDIGDPKHLFLMACVEFDGGAAGDEQSACSSAELTPTETVSPIGELPHSSTDEEENDDDLPIDLNQVLAEIIGSTVPPENPANGRKRNGERLTEPPAKKLYLESENIAGTSELNDSNYLDELVAIWESTVASTSTSFDGWKHKDNNGCRSCGQSVSLSGRYRHVLEMHVNKADMFACSVCDFAHPSSITEVRKHALEHTYTNAYPQSNEMKYRTLIHQWMRRCFDDWKTVDTSAEDARNGTGYDYDDAINNGNRSPPNNIDPANVDERTCQLCWEESRYPGRHLAQKHLRKPLYECPVCEGFGSYESCTVVKHMLKVHPDVEDPQPTSNLEKYADEIRDLQNRCFPKRPMKLVKPAIGSKPRERHLCNLCNTYVAQSDRQRHVYHRHLQKTRVFECPMCDFASNYDVHRVKWHIKWEHKEEPFHLEPVSHEAEFRDLIDQLNEECFPGWTHRRKSFWWLDQDDPQARAAKIKIKEDAEMSGSDLVHDFKNDADPEFEMTEEDLENAYSSPPPKESLNPHQCQLCQKELKSNSNFLRHVSKDHLSATIYSCPVCNDFETCDPYRMKHHSLKTHNKLDVVPVMKKGRDKRPIDEVRTIYTQCFPKKKMKEPAHQEKRATTPPPEDVKPKRRSSNGPPTPVVNVPPKKSRGRNRWDGEDGKVTCTQCSMDMKTEDRQIHVYRHHLKEPRLYECPLCDFSHHACSSDVRSHIKYVHRDNSELMPRANLLEFSDKIAEWNDLCFPGWINRRLPSSGMEDFSTCRLCGEEVRQTSRHIAEVHLKIPLHQCPLCDYGAAESRLVARHLRNNHTKKEAKGLEPISNVALRRADFSGVHDRCFPGRPKRLSNITISEEGRRAKCKGCGSTVSKKKRLSHLLERHLQIAFLKCKSCDFEHTYDDAEVKKHIADVHAGAGGMDAALNKHYAEVSQCVQNCFPDWEIKKMDLLHYSYVC
ncbi:unnamed protein product, partial [Mesorhabditis spiculigera]